MFTASGPPFLAVILMNCKITEDFAKLFVSKIASTCFASFLVEPIEKFANDKISQTTKGSTKTFF